MLITTSKMALWDKRCPKHIMWRNQIEKFYFYVILMKQRKIDWLLNIIKVIGRQGNIFVSIIYVFNKNHGTYHCPYLLFLAMYSFWKWEYDEYTPMNMQHTNYTKQQEIFKHTDSHHHRVTYSWFCEYFVCSKPSSYSFSKHLPFIYLFVNIRFLWN